MAQLLLPLSRKRKLKMSQKDKENDAEKNMARLSSYPAVLSVRQKDAIEQPFKSGRNDTSHLTGYCIAMK